MKRVFTGLLVLSVAILSGLDRTKTIDDVIFPTIQYACGGGDDLISHYYEQLVQQATLSREDWEDQFGDRDDHGTGSYGIKAMVGAVAELQLIEESEEKLENAYDFLLTSDPEESSVEHYLSIADVIDSLEEEPEGDAAYGLVDVFSLAYTLNNLAMIVDMLWYYEDGDHQDELADKLDLLANWTYDKIINSQNGAYTYEGVSGDPIKFSTGYNNIRLIVLGALGYAGVVLDSLDYINKVDWELLDRPGHDVEALLDHLSQTSGIYAEGLGYRSMSFLGLSNYFTARKRYHDPGELDHGYINYYDNINLSKMFEESMYLLYPDLSFVPFDDCWKINYGSGIELNPNILNEYLYPPYGMIEYYYQQDYANPEILDLIRFYINERQESDDSIEYPVMIFGGMKLPIILSFEENHVDIYGDSSIPATIQESNYSNEEFTVLRNGLESEIDFRENLAIWVNHENYESYKILHEQGDQTSFSLYYKGRNLTLS